MPGTDGLLYFPLFFNYGVMPETPWFTGRLSDDGAQLTVYGSHSLGTYDGLAYFFFIGDSKTMCDSLTFNLKDDAVMGTENRFYIMWANEGDPYCTTLSSVFCVSAYRADDGDVFNKPVERSLTAKIVTKEGVTEVESTVVDYESPRLGGHFMKGVIPYYPELWVFMPYGENGCITADSNTVDSSTMVYINDGVTNPNEVDLKAEVQNVCEFRPNGDGSYTMDDRWAWSNLYYDEELEMLMTNMACYDITIGAPQTAGIADAASGQAAAPTSSEYYDLSGRRVSAAAKGVVVRVDKYADGTRRAVKTAR